MSDRTRTLLDAYKQKRSACPDTAGEVDPLRRAYRQAAAVLHQFSPDVIVPLSKMSPSENPRLLLFDDIERATGAWSDSLFSLKADVRRTALAELRTREAMVAALDANPSRPRTALQAMWEGYLRTGRVPPLHSLGYRELTQLGQILAWVDGLHDGLPAPDDVLELARRKSMLASVEHLVKREFTGRDDELAALRDYVGARPAERGLHAVRRQLEQWRTGTRRPILAMHGPGGIGKTALIGKLLVEHAQADPEARMPFAYLPFDQPSLRIDAPFTLLLEAASQFELQFPEHRPVIEGFRDGARKVGDFRADVGGRRRGSGSRSARIRGVQDLDRDLCLSFASMLGELGKRTFTGGTVHSPVLVVFDTFEEVQYRDRESLLGFWRMLDIIQEGYEPFRAIISGRGPIAGVGPATPPLQQMSLVELREEDRVTLLQRLGVSDRKLAEAVARQVGGNPLSLHLAAGVVVADPAAAQATGITGLSAGIGLSFRVDQEIIQGQLYRRILDHIHDENVRRLAHPGMVLRRVTPEVILEVLAPQCLQSVTEMAEAERLFEGLKREHALVTLEDGALVYRPEIRRSMVRLLEQDRYASVRALRRAAIDYYSRSSGAAERAEEMYHRLALGEDELHVLDARWLPGIEASVVLGLEEYPDRMKAWLASRASLEVPRSVFATADAAEWERNITRKVQRALSELQTDWALNLLGERPERTAASPLFALEAKTHMLRGDLGGAARSLEEGIARVSTSTNRGRLAELFWLRSQVELLGKAPEPADRSLAEAEKAIESARSPIPLTHVLCHRLLLRRLHPASYGERSPGLRLRLDRSCRRIDDDTAYAAEFVVRLAVDLLESEHPQTRDRLSGFVDPGTPAFSGDPLTSENLQGLDEYREAWERDTDPSPEAAA